MKAAYLAIALLFAGVCGSGAQANDFGVSGIGGSWYPTAGEHPSIQMLSERVRIDIFQGKGYDRYYDTTVDFIFWNHGPATSVNMAFPERADGADALSEEDSSSSFRGFQSSVNGQLVKVKRVVSKRRFEYGVDYTALWIKRVSFAKGERKAVKVKYRSPSGSATQVGQFAAYDFSGGNWFGKVESSALTVVLHTATGAPVRTFFANKSVPMSRKGNTFTYTWRNWQANGPFRFWYDIDPSARNAADKTFDVASE